MCVYEIDCPLNIATIIMYEISGEIVSPFCVCIGHV